MIYFDNSATTKPYPEVLDSFMKVSREYYGNPSSLHAIGGHAEKLLIQARKQIAGIINVKPREVYFTSGGTESNNLAIKGAALQHKNRGNHIIITAVEHASVSEAANQLKELGFTVTVIPVNSFGCIDVADIEGAIRPDTILVSIIHVNNEVGTIQPIEEVGILLKTYPKILFHVDHVQGVGKVPLDLSNMSVDLCSFSAHKFHGLKGTGILYIKEGVNIFPLFSGGNQEERRRSGTENVAGMVAMAKALRLSMERQQEQLMELVKIKEYLIEELGKAEGITVHTPQHHSAPHIINFSVLGVKGETFVHALENKDIYISTTSACSSKKKSASRTLLAMGVPEVIAYSAVRISLSYENSMDEAKQVIKAIKDTVKNLKEVVDYK